MTIKQIILERIDKKEFHKLNVMSFYLQTPPASARRMVYLKNGCECEFYNSTDIISGTLFHKKVSLLPINKK